MYMKKSILIVLVTAIVGLFVLGLPKKLSACNLTDISLISVSSGPGLNMTITFRFCVGYGVTGATKGADGATGRIAFGWYTTQTVPAFSIVSWTPTAISSTVTTPNCTMTSFNVNNPPGIYVPARRATFFQPPASCTNSFVCVSSTANCSDVGQLCWNYAFVVNYVPDSVRLFGAEGAGNGVAGCYPNPDMKIDFTTLSVIWGDIAAKTLENTVEVNWSTLQETNSDMFFVEHYNAASNAFEVIATLPATGNVTEVTKYTITDVSPNVGINRYRVVQVSKNGTSSESESVEATMDAPNKLVWGAVGPVPTLGNVRLNFISPAQENGLLLQLVDMSGKLVAEQKLNANVGTNVIDLDLTDTDAGIYIVRLRAKELTLFYKVVKE
jgi:hypothetical protein